MYERKVVCTSAYQRVMLQDVHTVYGMACMRVYGINTCSVYLLKLPMSAARRCQSIYWYHKPEICVTVCTVVCLSAAEQSWGSSTAEHNSWVEQTSSAPGSWAEQASHSSHAPNAWGSAGANSQVHSAGWVTLTCRHSTTVI